METYNEFVSRTCIEMCDESFEDEDAGEEDGENRGEEEDHWQTCESSEILAPPRERDVLWPTLLHTERALGSPVHG